MGKRGKRVKEHVMKTHGQTQKWVGLRVGGEGGWGVEKW